MSYLKNNFLLSNKTAERLYFEYAQEMPIFDYHCHLSERELLQNAPCSDLSTLWLGGDHYKWRLMRNFGIDEELLRRNRSRDRVLCRLSRKGRRPRAQYARILRTYRRDRK